MKDLFRKIGALIQTVVRPAHLYTGPIHLQYEPSSRCNLNCIHCEHDKNRKNPANATFDDFKKVFDAVKPLYITLSGYGEPLMCKELPRMIRYTREKGAQVNTTTNGVLLKNYAEAFIESGLQLLNVSLDAARKETYLNVRGQDVFPVIVENIKEFNKLRRSSASPIKLRLSMVIQEANVHELIEFAQLSKELEADALVFQIVETGFLEQRPGDVVGGMTKEQLRKALEEASAKLAALGIPSNIDWLARHLDMLWQHHILRKENRCRQCRKIWHSVYITVDGAVRPCCNFVTDDIEMGNINAGKFKTALNSKRFKTFRRSLTKGKRPLKPCKVCVPETIREVVFRDKF
ncbi:MAG: radical SAM protein [bacterium]|nr:radical SAM protein [bacterium]